MEPRAFKSIGLKTFKSQPLLDYRTLLGRDKSIELGATLEGRFRWAVEQSRNATTLDEFAEQLSKALGLNIAAKTLLKFIDRHSDLVMFPATHLHPDLNKMYGGLFHHIVQKLAQGDAKLSQMFGQPVATQGAPQQGMTLARIYNALAPVGTLTDDEFLQIMSELSQRDVDNMCATSTMFESMCRKHRRWLAGNVLRREVLMHAQAVNDMADKDVVRTFLAAHTIRKQLHMHAAFFNFARFFQLLNCDLDSGKVFIDVNGNPLEVNVDTFLSDMELPNDKFVQHIPFPKKKRNFVVKTALQGLCEMLVFPLEEYVDDDLADRIEHGVDEDGAYVPDGYYERLYANGMMMPWRDNSVEATFKTLSLAALIHRAFDIAATYRAKSKGRDRITCHPGKRLTNLTVEPYPPFMITFHCG